MLGTTGAGLAIARCPVIISIASWSLIASPNLFKVDNHIQLSRAIRDVIDIASSSLTIVRYPAERTRKEQA